jgi:hypothetical protein
MLAQKQDRCANVLVCCVGIWKDAVPEVRVWVVTFGIIFGSAALVLLAVWMVGRLVPVCSILGLVEKCTSQGPLVDGVLEGAIRSRRRRGRQQDARLLKKLSLS